MLVRLLCLVPVLDFRMTFHAACHEGRPVSPSDPDKYRPEYRRFLDTLSDSRVRSIMNNVQRSVYSTLTDNPYSLEPQPITTGPVKVNTSAPSVIASALMLFNKHLEADQVKNAIDIGSGCGYVTTCMAHLFPTANVWGLERLAELVPRAQSCLQGDEFSRSKSVTNRVKFALCNALSIQDFKEAVSPPIYGNIQAIHMGTAHRGVPESVRGALATGGVFVFPEGFTVEGTYALEEERQELRAYRKQPDGSMQLIERSFAVVYVEAVNKRPE